MTDIINDNYISEYKHFLDSSLYEFVNECLELLDEAGATSRYFFAGNGASAAIASHLANDFTKAVGVRAFTFHDPALITCFGNDFGFENWLAEAVKRFGDAGDVLFLISASGRSENVNNAAAIAKENGLYVVSLVGPDPSPGLVETSDLMLKVQSQKYNIIECCHMIALCAVVDSRHLVTLNLNRSKLSLPP